MPAIKLSTYAVEHLQCPVCNGTIAVQEALCSCQNPACKREFPIFNGIPIILNEKDTVFASEDFIREKDTFYNTYYIAPWMRFIKKILPDIHRSIRSRSNLEKLSKIVLTRFQQPKILVIGGSFLGEGLEYFANQPSMELTETDVSLGPRLQMICDGHFLPFQNETFDVVIVQVVLEHVADPYRCVEEIHRVIKPEGVVYAETPFMQQVHGGAFDFTRFTFLGHRRLFRMFTELDAGILCGPGMALAWSYQYFFLSFFTSKWMRRFVFGFTRLTAFWLKYFDYYLVTQKPALDASSAFYFSGTKSNTPITDEEIMTTYWNKARH